MAFEANFVPGASDLFEPTLKLRMQLGRYDVESYAQDAQLWYDPEIRADRLTMPMSRFQQTIWNRHNPNTPSPDVSFTSDAGVKLIDLILTYSRTPDELVLRLRNGEHGFRLNARLIEKFGPPEFQGHGYDILNAAIQALLTIPGWDIEAKRCGLPAIAFYMERPLAEELAANSSFRFNAAVKGDVLVARRQVFQSPAPES